MEVYLQVRRAHFDEGRSKRSIARDFGLARGTVDKMCAFPMPPGYRRSRDVRRPKLEGFTGTIDQWLLEDLARPKKQRHTVKRMSIPEQKGSIHRRNSPQFSGTGTALAHVLPIELTRAKARWPQASIDAVGLLRDQVLVLRL